MSYNYNPKISRQAGEAPGRREKILQNKRAAAALAAVFILAAAVLLGSGIRAFASAGEEPALHKYYTAIQVQSGDTLWDIAGRYTADGIVNREAFIEEVTELNGLKDGRIRSGDYIIVSYYSKEEQ